MLALVAVAACASPYVAVRERARSEAGAQVVVVDIANDETVIAVAGDVPRYAIYAARALAAEITQRLLR